MMERIRRLNEHVKEYRAKDRDKDASIKRLKEKIDKLKAYIVKHIKSQGGSNNVDIPPLSMMQDSTFSNQLHT